MNFLLRYGWCLLLIACNGSQKSIGEKMIMERETLIIESLTCEKLSEKLAGFGSVNDEIILAVYLTKENELIELIWHSDILKVGEEGEKMVLNEKLSLKTMNDQHRIKMVLIEQDTERSADEILQLLTTLLKEKKSNEEIRTIIRDDDLLGIKAMDIKSTTNTGEVKFWGMQLFDEYDYRLMYRLE